MVCNDEADGRPRTEGDPVSSPFYSARNGIKESLQQRPHPLGREVSCLFPKSFAPLVAACARMRGSDHPHAGAGGYQTGRGLTKGTAGASSRTCWSLWYRHPEVGERKTTKRSISNSPFGLQQ